MPSIAGCGAHADQPVSPAPQALTPPMGWNSWNSGIQLSERTVEDTIDAMVRSGMRDAGYRYVDLDAGWAAASRDAAGNLRADPARFPAGISAVARYAHDHGMLLGLYASPSYELCGLGAPNASEGHESGDAATFARWGVDYLKYDWCSTDSDLAHEVRDFTAMRDALRATGRPIFYSINPNTSGDPGAGSDYDWSSVADMSRNTVDLVPLWHNQFGADQPVLGVWEQITAAAPLAGRSRPGYFNDPDMLVAGIPWPAFMTSHPGMIETLAGQSGPSMTDAEQRSHVSLWAMMSAPLLAGNDIRSMSQQTREILTNPDIIAVDQDRLVRQARPLAQDPRVMVKPLVDGAVAVAMVNPGQQPASIATTASAVGLPATGCYGVRDLWSHTASTTTGDLPAGQVAPHATVVLRVEPRC
ncbi:glycoside hydrolase family 27 protein [Mycolicibacterium sp. CH28]|nr:glycoside hydrolase family 27 protein [Mycolicibacterium sp. CH28]